MFTCRIKRQREGHEAALENAQNLWVTHGCSMFDAESTLQYTAQLTHTGAAPQIRTRTEPPTRMLIGGWHFEEYHIGSRTSNCRSTPDAKQPVGSARTKAELQELRGMLKLQEYENLTIDEVPDMIEDIQRNLAAQSKLQQDIFSGVKTRVRPRLQCKRSRTHLTLASYAVSSRRSQRATSTPSRTAALIRLR